MALSWQRLTTTSYVIFISNAVTIETTGILTPEEIFYRALDILDEKAKAYSIWFIEGSL